MLSYLIRLGKRFAVLVPGLIIAYFSVSDIFPYFHTHLPLGFAVFVTYILAAYVLIPAIIRFFRILFPPSHLPLYCVTPDGFASDPLNIGIIGTRAELIAAMEQAGWHQADKHTLRNALHEGLSTVYGWFYPNAPMSHLYLFGRMQDIGFQIPIEDGKPGSRHHVRFWATTYDNDKRLSVRTIYWHKRNARVQGDSLLWVGAASRDVGIAYIRHNIQLTHMIDPDTDAERGLIVQQLAAAGLARAGQSIKLREPYKVTNRAWRGYVQTDANPQTKTSRITGFALCLHPGWDSRATSFSLRYWGRPARWRR
jgi:hypothetical protein